jgi:hypothetical protein
MTVAALNLEPGACARFFVEFVAADGTVVASHHNPGKCR